MAAPAETGNTLAILAKRKVADKESTSRAGRWIHHVGEDTVDESLQVYFCAYCGAHSLILDVLVSELPLRRSDGARVVQLNKHATQLLLDEGPCVKLKRSPGGAGAGSAGAGASAGAVAGKPSAPLVEKQYRYLCKGCGLPLAYLSQPFRDGSNKYLYLMADAFALTADGKSLAQLQAEEKAKAAEVPIVIPIFNVKKLAASSSEGAAASAAPAAASSASSGSASAAAPTAAVTAAAAAPAAADQSKA